MASRHPPAPYETTMEELKLALHIALPVLVAVVLAARKAQGKGWKRLVDVFHLNANQGLFDQPLFHVGMLIPTLLFLSFGSIAWSGYDIDLSATGFDAFIKLSKLPLALLSLVVPIGAIISSFHSTKQTAAQIKITELKSNLDSYYQHRTELFNYFDRLEEKRYLNSLSGKFRAHPSLHKRMFDGAPELGAPMPNLASFYKVYGDLAKASVLLEETFQSNMHEPRLASYIGACALVIESAYQLGLDEIYNGPAEQKYNVQGMIVRPLGNSVEEHIACLRYLGDYFNYLVDFCGGIHFAPAKFGTLMDSPLLNPSNAKLSLAACWGVIRYEHGVSSMQQQATALAQAPK